MNRKFLTADLATHTRLSIRSAICASTLFLAAQLMAGENALPKLQVQDTPIQRDPKLGTSYAPIIKKAAASVVNVYSTKTVKESDLRNSPLFNDPLFRRFFGGPEEGEDPSERRPRSRQEQALGSGVIVSEDGYIMTNNHVVEGADEIKVGLPNGDELPAKVVGTDPATDSAVLKVDKKGLPSIVIGNSENLEVGDVVLAIGNPFGLGQTVTMGIISATGRGDLGIIDYEDFIQTDASINPGNSGGALVDAEGRLIGINTAILSRTGGNQGVGFAIPINRARYVMERLIQYGKVARGYLGVYLQPMNPDLAKEFNLSDQHGVIVAQVSKNTPAAEAGLKEGDVIVELNGKKVADRRNLRLTIASTAPNTVVNLKVIRDGKEKNFKVKLGELPSEALAANQGKDLKPEGESEALDGVEVTDIDARARRQFGIPNNIAGALVVNVDPDSTSAAKGLRPGDVILEINRKPIESADEAVEMSKNIKTKTTLLRVWSRGTGSHYISVENKSANKKK